MNMHLQKTVTRLLAILICAGFSTLHTIPYVGTITFPTNLKTPECPGVYYNGYTLEHEIQTHPYAMASFKIEQVRSGSPLGLLFISQAAHPSCKNNRNIPQCLKLAPQSSYAYYRLSPVEKCEVTQNQETAKLGETKKCFLTWDLVKTELKENIIPENSIIVLINPDLIDLNNVVWDILDNYIPLPKIAIKNEKNIGNTMTRLQFAKCTMNSFHERTKSSTDILPHQTNITMRKKCSDQCL